MEDIPSDLVVAVEQGFRILSWHEHLSEEERPPRWMWHLDDELDSWFDQVDKMRKEKYGGSSDDESGEMMTNELAEQYKAGGG